MHSRMHAGRGFKLGREAFLSGVLVGVICSGGFVVAVVVLVVGVRGR